MLENTADMSLVEINVVNQMSPQGKQFRPCSTVKPDLRYHLFFQIQLIFHAS